MKYLLYPPLHILLVFAEKKRKYLKPISLKLKNPETGEIKKILLILEMRCVCGVLVENIMG